MPSLNDVGIFFGFSYPSGTLNPPPSPSNVILSVAKRREVGVETLIVQRP
jgi:hypothetical protein